jgi:hypothetical protein
MRHGAEDQCLGHIAGAATSGIDGAILLAAEPDIFCARTDLPDKWCAASLAEAFPVRKNFPEKQNLIRRFNGLGSSSVEA